MNRVTPSRALSARTPVGPEGWNEGGDPVVHGLEGAVGAERR